MALSFVYAAVMDMLMASAELRLNKEFLKRLVTIRSDYVLCLLLDGPGFLFISMTASIFTLTAIAFEKYVAIFHPLRYPALITRNRSIIAILIIWFISVMIGLLPLMGWNRFDGVCLFVEKISYSYLVSWGALGLAAMLLTLVLYARMFLVARKHSKSVHPTVNFRKETRPSLISHRTCPDLKKLIMINEDSGLGTSKEQSETCFTTLNNVSESKRDNRKRKNGISKLNFVETITRVESIKKHTSVGLPVPNAIGTASMVELPVLWRKERKRARQTSKLSIFITEKIQEIAPPIKAIKTIAVILGAFYICWLPLVIYLLTNPRRYTNFSIFCLALLALCNSLFNPLVYGFRERKLRKKVLSFFYCRKKDC
ncbi:DgyrCDS13314 [Dimorphilus gyrociliatus]|uniref:DgyrCDS13314 n=1 Tax=Dimorphilus gyrociliatus TaxID=2664684 RepID=A0A7I8WAA5_9ANNE|nr:DgyrCDS13314 [Dimorphilus gyrociliatus]